MTEQDANIQTELLRHAERQTKALESINTYFLRLVAVLTVLGVLLLVAWITR